MSIPQSSGAITMGLPGANPPQGANQPPGNNASLYIGDLDEEVNESVIFEKFNSIGQIISIRVCRDMISKKSLGYAYLNFSLPADAEKAIDTLNFDTIRGRQMRIMWSQRDPSLRRSGVGNLFIKNLEKSVTTRELYDTFSLFGEILSCKIATDDKGNSKGYGFIHFSTKEGADKAIERLNDKIIKSKKIFVAPFVPKTMRAPGDNSEPSFNNVFVKNFGEDMDEERLKKMFSPYGEITSCKVEAVDGKSRGFGFVCYKDPQSAVEAVNELNNKDVDGKTLFVGRAMKKGERAEFLRQQFEKKKNDKTKRFQVGVNLYVKNLEDTMDDETLKTEFSTYGKVTSVRVMRDSSGRSKGFGFVCFNSAEDATRAVTELNGRLVCGKPLYVALAQRKEERRAHLANQYLQRQMAMRTQMPQQPAMMNQAQAMSMLMNFQSQNPAAAAAFFPSVRGMFPPQAAANMGFQQPRPNRWNAPQPNHMRGPAPNAQGGPGMMQQNFNNRMIRPGGGMNQSMPQPMGMRGVRPGGDVNSQQASGMNMGNIQAAQGGAMVNMRPPANVQYTANARNIQFGQQQRPAMPQPQMQPTQMPPVQPTTISAPTVEPVTANGDGFGDESVSDTTFLSAIASKTLEEQKQMLGEKMYEMIRLWYPDHAGKLTGMLLELDNRELMSMYMEANALKSDQDIMKSAFRNRVDSAFEVLKKQGIQGKGAAKTAAENDA